MNRIAAIAPAAGRSGWSEVRLEDPRADLRSGGEEGRSLLLPDDDVRRLGLAPGDAVDLERLRSLRDQALAAEATHIALRYLSVRPRSRRELELRLRRKGVAPRLIEPALARCAELGYVDDRAFAAALSRDRIRLRPSGRRRLRDELRSRGVSEADAEAGIQEAFRDERVTEEELLERAARARADRMRRLKLDVAKRRLFRFLRRRGFDAGGIHAWLAAWEAERGDGPDESNGSGDVAYGESSE